MVIDNNKNFVLKWQIRRCGHASLIKLVRLIIDNDIYMFKISQKFEQVTLLRDKWYVISRTNR